MSVSLVGRWWPPPLQILMTIGTLRESHRFLDVEEQRLMQRRPDLRAALQKPDGRQVIQGDSEVAAER